MQLQLQLQLHSFGGPGTHRSRNRAGSPTTLPSKEGRHIMAPISSGSNIGSAPNSTPRPVKPPPVSTTPGRDPLYGPAAGVTSPGSGPSTKKTDPIGAQTTDPPWWRFVFFLFNGRDGQWWSVILAAVLVVLLLLVALAGLVMMATLLSGGVWISGILSIGGSLTGGTLLWRHRRNTTSR